MGAFFPESAAEQLGTVLCTGAENRLQAKALRGCYSFSRPCRPSKPAGDFLGPVAFPGPSSHLSAYIHTHCGDEEGMYPS